MDKKENILQETADTVIAKPYTFDIDVIPQNRFHWWLQRLGLAPKKKSFQIRPIVYGNLMRISKLLVGIDPEIFKGKSLVDMSHKMIAEHAEKLPVILAIAIQNNKHEPSKDLISFLTNNLAAEEMFLLITYVIDKMDLRNFLATIISIRGLNVQESEEKPKESNEVSPLSQGSQIALGSLLAVS